MESTRKQIRAQVSDANAVFREYAVISTLKKWLEGVVEAFLDFDEESFVFIAGFAVVSLS